MWMDLALMGIGADRRGQSDICSLASILITRDGPALRALAMIPYAHYLLDRGWPADIAYVEDKLYNPTTLRQAGSVIKNDLEEVGGGWWLESFDLWEEV
jgi:glucoamylase